MGKTRALTHQDELRAQNFVEAYLRTGIATDAVVSAGYTTEGLRHVSAKASNLLKTPYVQELLRTALPQRNPSEMGRVYGKLCKATGEACVQYEAILKDAGRMSKQGIDNAATWFKLVLDALKMQGQAAGLFVRAHVDSDDKPVVTIVQQQVTIVAPKDPLPPAEPSRPLAVLPPESQGLSRLSGEVSSE